MNRHEFLRELERALRARKVADVQEILKEYQEHFDFKLSEGFSEEEIAARLDSPTAIAAQFEGEADFHEPAGVPTRIGLGFLAILATMALLLLYGLNIVFAGFSIALVSLGFCLVLNLNVAGLIPLIPYAGRLLLGTSFIGLGAVSAVATTWCFLYVHQWVRSYIHWHRNTVKGWEESCPALHPEVSPGARQVLRKIALIAGVTGGVLFCIGVFYMFAYTDFKPFWHELNWFQ